MVSEYSLAAPNAYGVVRQGENETGKPVFLGMTRVKSDRTYPKP